MILLLILALSAHGEPIRLELQARSQPACEQYVAYFVGEIERAGGVVKRAECRKS